MPVQPPSGAGIPVPAPIRPAAGNEQGPAGGSLPSAAAQQHPIGSRQPLPPGEQQTRPRLPQLGSPKLRTQGKPLTPGSTQLLDRLASSNSAVHQAASRAVRAALADGSLRSTADERISAVEFSVPDAGPGVALVEVRPQPTGEVHLHRMRPLEVEPEPPPQDRAAPPEEAAGQGQERLHPEEEAHSPSRSSADTGMSSGAGLPVRERKRVKVSHVGDEVSAQLDWTTRPAGAVGAQPLALVPTGGTRINFAATPGGGTLLGLSAPVGTPASTAPQRRRIRASPSAAELVKGLDNPHSVVPVKLFLRHLSDGKLPGCRALAATLFKDDDQCSPNERDEIFGQFPKSTGEPRPTRKDVQMAFNGLVRLGLLQEERARGFAFLGQLEVGMFDEHKIGRADFEGRSTDEQLKIIGDILNNRSESMQMAQSLQAIGVLAADADISFVDDAGTDRNVQVAKQLFFNKLAGRALGEPMSEEEFGNLQPAQCEAIYKRFALEHDGDASARHQVAWAGLALEKDGLVRQQAVRATRFVASLQNGGFSKVCMTEEAFMALPKVQRLAVVEEALNRAKNADKSVVIAALRHMDILEQ
ncbi:MAG TPA: hypothetical protein VF169_01250 [Albitalea sp.]|uniref:hypothetical protein n=1 Tax=Piscinibacter sp. TaxID=1903157 RepID=UPI002ED644A2